MRTKFIFETRMQVRDYECDIEGIVNNATTCTIVSIQGTCSCNSAA